MLDELVVEVVFAHTLLDEVFERGNELSFEVVLEEVVVGDQGLNPNRGLVAEVAPDGVVDVTGGLVEVEHEGDRHESMWCGVALETDDGVVVDHVEGKGCAL